ncbi:M20 family metallopeptidase [Bacillus sp. DTU_2020_1000418_1_SI_GHA_SEK_038]|uniref:M20 family metallopeptidase n=1 Tax=Bacillus sp. DTU_2020_1000418_1_SI_GHA_SEK_038 TaxID=3077585 RepID=UPI0028E415C3|nr:M20 family metallopeptidase [Bacillus sp. DTU_2020_1000418_1_SI_GHA_SEK_038]WNS76598.1 M20 family metallopeptidase [Bacillus sp. DTU_2020_1000418_1_SI_GHA_SEK_038]
MNKLYELLDQAYDEMVEVRRYLHQYPELSFQEENTPKYIAEYHEKLGHEVRTGVGGRGVVATLRGGKPGQTVALRADFDALPIQEENDVPYKSKVAGVMHACGHDSHTATLLILAKVLNSMKEEIEGNIVFIHQHAEEVLPGGAIAMIEDGCLAGVDVIFGQHIWSTAPVGTIEYRQGPMMAAADFFKVKIKGRGGHGSQPHRTKDSVVIGSQLVGNIQQIVSRRVDPLDTAVISIGSFEAKNAPNVIADSASLAGTVRTFKDETREYIESEIERIIKGTCLAADAEYTYEYQKGYPATVNPKQEMEFIVELAKQVPGVTAVVECEPQMGGEDFAYYLQKVKGAFFFTGGQNPEWKETYPHHHPKFDIDEKGMLIAAKTLGIATLTYLENNK